MDRIKLTRIFLCSLLAIQCCTPADGPDSGVHASEGRGDIKLGTVRIGARSVQFYVDLDSDGAVLGFSVANDSGQLRYFPLYGSTYRGLPPVTLDVYVSGNREEMWVRSSWPGYEILAYHRMGTDQCTTRYGEIASFGKPMPEILSGRTKPFPAMGRENVSKVATFRYDGTHGGTMPADRD